MLKNFFNAKNMPKVNLNSAVQHLDHKFTNTH